MRYFFAHYLLNGKRGKYARGFIDYLNKAITGRGGVDYTPIKATDRRVLSLDRRRRPAGSTRTSG